mmetsp:Transcript_27143/g.62471  ORF Transcript_27143/g.62471 Transcript_27143/m.62471 type:complete len:255 (+) Transcript_27143:361-1125(+)
MGRALGPAGGRWCCGWCCGCGCAPAAKCEAAPGEVVARQIGTSILTESAADRDALRAPSPPLAASPRGCVCCAPAPAPSPGTLSAVHGPHTRSDAALAAAPTIKSDSSEAAPARNGTGKRNTGPSSAGGHASACRTSPTSTSGTSAPCSAGSTGAPAANPLLFSLLPPPPPLKIFSRSIPASHMGQRWYCCAAWPRHSAQKRCEHESTVGSLSVQRQIPHAASFSQSSHPGTFAKRSLSNTCARAQMRPSCELV